MDLQLPLLPDHCRGQLGSHFTAPLSLRRHQLRAIARLSNGVFHALARCNTGRGRSERFLAFVQTFDARSNSFPSMHTSVAMLTALHLYSSLGPVVFVFPALIALSCLY